MMNQETDAFLDALADLEGALDQSLQMTEQMKHRIGEIRESVNAGQPLRAVVPSEQRPLLVQLLTENANVLQSYGARVRRTEARALHRKGVTMDEIAQLFGVSRQRVSALLREPPSQGE